MSRVISQYFISVGASWGNFSVNMATKVLKADSHWLKLWIFLEGWRGSRVNWGGLGELSVNLKYKEYLSEAGETESSAPKSMYSLAQIFLLSLGVKLLPRATAILANGVLLPGNGSPIGWRTWRCTFGQKRNFFVNHCFYASRLVLAPVNLRLGNLPKGPLNCLSYSEGNRRS